MERVVLDWYLKNGLSGYELDLKDFEIIGSICTELFFAAFCRERYGLTYLIPAYRQELVDSLLEKGDMPLWEEDRNANDPLRTILAAKTLFELAPLTHESSTLIRGLENFAFPSLQSIPMRDFIHYLDTSKYIPLVERAKQIAEQYGKSLTTENLAHALIEDYMRVVNILRPNAVDLVASIVSNIPLPFMQLNPVSLLASTKTWLLQRKINKDYAWMLVLADLDNLRTEFRGHGTKFQQ
jgi:hypothetical protein